MAAELQRISVDLSEQDIERLDALAALRGESRAETVRFMLSEVCDGDALAEDLAGLAELDRGEGVPLADVLARAGEIVDAAKARKIGNH